MSEGKNKKNQFNGGFEKFKKKTNKNKIKFDRNKPWKNDRPNRDR
jgi:hypothetical protein